MLRIATLEEATLIGAAIIVLLHQLYMPGSALVSAING